jgi:phosphoribosylformylglycinamidine (FGAM) synthase-like enzyme
VSSAPEPLHRALGLSDPELEDIRAVLGRDPNHLELALYAVMWSEHCSYKSSRIHLRRLPTEAPHVLVGPGENAGVIDAGDGIAVAIPTRGPRPASGGYCATSSRWARVRSS